MPSEKAEVTSHTGSGDFNCYLTSTIRSIQTSLPTREVGISTVRIFKGRGHLASHFPHGKWGFQHGGPSWGQVQPCHFPHGKWGFQLSYIAPHTRSGDFNLIFSAQKSGREVAPHTGAGVSTQKLRPWYYPGAVAPHTGSGDFNSYAKAESMFDNVTPRVGSGDFNRHSNCRRFQFSVAPHTESGNFNLICPGKTLESGRHFPHGKWGFQQGAGGNPNPDQPSLLARGVWISTTFSFSKLLRAKVASRTGSVDLNLKSWPCVHHDTAVTPRAYGHVSVVIPHLGSGDFNR